MNDLLARLRALSRMEHSDHTIGDEAAAALEAMQLQLRLFTGAAYPVSTEIDPRGYRWSDAYLDQALAAMKAGEGSTR